MILSLLIAYSPIGEWFFGSVLGVKDNMIGPTVSAYRVLMFVTIFSGIRCLYHGVIISNLRTKWLTLGMIIRLVVMALLAWTLLKFGLVNHGYIGAYIFLAGMVIEAIVSMIEGRSLVRKMPEKKARSSGRTPFTCIEILYAFIACFVNCCNHFTYNQWCVRIK